MKRMKFSLREIFDEIPKDKREAARLSFAVSDRLFYLMESKGLSKKQLADNLGKRPNEITRWLSGEHNFTLSTIAMLSTYFGEPIIDVIA